MSEPGSTDLPMEWAVINRGDIVYSPRHQGWLVLTELHYNAWLYERFDSKDQATAYSNKLLASLEKEGE